MGNFVSPSNLETILGKIKSWVEGKGYITSADVPEGAVASNTSPKMNGTATVGTETAFARGDHIHPTDTSRASSSHAHGNVTNDGAITATGVAIASGDAIAIVDSSDSSKLAKTSITFDGSTMSTALTQKGTWGTFLTSHQSLDSCEKTANRVTSVSSSSDNSHYPTAKAVYDAISSGISASDAMIYKGTIASSSGTYTGTTFGALTTYKTGWTFKVATAGTYAGAVCQIGDMLIALRDCDGTFRNADWTVVQGNIQAFDTTLKGKSTSTNAPTTKAVLEFLAQYVEVTTTTGTATGSATKGVYINGNNKATEMTYSLNADVPAGAVFTDTVLTESDVSGWGFTKNTGTYSKPSDGIPAVDLASTVRTSLGKADTALQSVPSASATVKGITTVGASGGAAAYSHSHDYTKDEALTPTQITDAFSNAGMATS